MDREKQIEEITKVIARRSMAFRNPNVAFMTTARKTANSLYNAGYRNQSEVAKEIFAEIEDSMSCFEDDDDGYLLKKCEFKFFMRELKKKYTEEPVND